ncbi:hypothetical protein C8Q73DRAFT_706349 [Cubamyces lactineus]|nr:hypothetical protein C8Q73DRAFT_706349 [Cubamyces lactineus]
MDTSAVLRPLRTGQSAPIALAGQLLEMICNAVSTHHLPDTSPGSVFTRQCLVRDRYFALQYASCLKTSTSCSTQQGIAMSHSCCPGYKTCLFARRPPRCSLACLAPVPRVRPPPSSPPHMTAAAAARTARTSLASSARAACGSSSASRPSLLGCSSAWRHSRGLRRDLPRLGASARAAGTPTRGARICRGVVIAREVYSGGLGSLGSWGGVGCSPGGRAFSTLYH